MTLNYDGNIDKTIADEIRELSQAHNIFYHIYINAKYEEYIKSKHVNIGHLGAGRVTFLVNNNDYIYTTENTLLISYKNFNSERLDEYKITFKDMSDDYHIHTIEKCINAFPYSISYMGVNEVRAKDVYVYVDYKVRVKER